MSAKVFCDKCGHEILPGYERIEMVNRHVLNGGMMLGQASYDFHKDCWESVTPFASCTPR